MSPPVLGKRGKYGQLRLLIGFHAAPLKAKGTLAISTQSTSRLAGDNHISLLNKTETEKPGIFSSKWQSSVPTHTVSLGFCLF